jgi:predicted Zn-dependent protease
MPLPHPSRRRLVLGACALAGLGLAGRGSRADVLDNLGGMINKGIQHAVPPAQFSGDKVALYGITISDDDEAVIARSALPVLFDRYGRYPNPRAELALRSFLQPLVTLSRRRFQWEVFVLDTEEVLAGALPGGKIAVSRGLLTYVAAPWELATVLGHQAGHAERSDALRADPGYGTLTAILPIRTLPEVVNEIYKRVPEQALRLHASGAEEAADDFLVAALAAAGRDPELASHFYHRLLRLFPQGVQPNCVFPGHSGMVGRIKRLEREAQDQPHVAPQWTSPEFNEIKGYFPTRPV